MNESLKTRFLWILLVLCILFLFAAVGFAFKLHKRIASYRSELTTRIETEEKNYNLLSKVSKMEKMVDRLTNQLNKEKAQHQETKDLLEEQKQDTMNLTLELESTIELKKKLEEDLKNLKMSGEGSMR